MKKSRTARAAPCDPGPPKRARSDRRSAHASTSSVIAHGSAAAAAPSTASATPTSCAPVPPSPCPLDPFTRLPSDIIIEIISLLPVRPRLLVLALLSKRWHACVLRSITSLGSHYELLMGFERIRHLPCITALTLTRELAVGCTEASLPTTLQSLTIEGYSRFTSDATWRLASLTRLCFAESLTSPSARKHWPPLFANLMPTYATALRALHLDRVSTTEGLVRHYPRLTSLHVTESVAVARLIALHADQILDLNLRFSRPDPELAQLQCRFPRLRRLSFKGDLSSLRSLLARIPSACTVSICLTPDMTEAECTYVVQVPPFQPMPPLHLLKLCTNLTSLEFTRDESVSSQALAPLKMLRKYSAPSLFLVLCTSRLRNLTLDWTRFGGLTDLCIIVGQCPVLEVFASRSIRLGDLVISDLEILARFAESRGLRKLRVRLSLYNPHDPKLAEVYQLARSLRWLHLRVREEHSID